VITTRLPVTDIADHEDGSALRRSLEHLSREAGAQLLRALGVKGQETELRSASDEFSGHCLALTLLGSYLTDAYDGVRNACSPLSKKSWAPAVVCLIFEVLCEWHLGEIDFSHDSMAAAISLSKELNDMHALTHTLWNAGFLAHLEGNPIQAEHCASELIELSTRQNFASWLAGAKVFRGWARSVSGDTAEGYFADTRL
jgi:hypothetical protein